MRVIRSTDGDRVNVRRFFVEHLAKVFVSPGFGMSSECSCRSFVVNVAQRNIVRAEFADRGDVPATHSARADAGDLKLLTGSHISGTSQHMSRNERETEYC